MTHYERVSRLRSLVERLDRLPASPDRDRLLLDSRQRLASLVGATYESSAWDAHRRSVPPDPDGDPLDRVLLESALIRPS